MLISQGWNCYGIRDIVSYLDEKKSQSHLHIACVIFAETLRNVQVIG